MKGSKIVVEVICLILMLNFFYEGIYKMANIHGYGIWMHNKPILKSDRTIFPYAISVGEIVVSGLFFIPSWRSQALYATIIFLIVFIFYAASLILIYHSISWPFDAVWKHPTWVQKIITSLGLCWIAFTAIVLSIPGFSIKKYISSSLRNTPVNVSR